MAPTNQKQDCKYIVHGQHKAHIITYITYNNVYNI